MATHRPPVIPEIAKAYQNDPRTKLAELALTNGTSTAPVAQGGWGAADGIARVLSALGGAYANKKVQERYGADEAQLLAERQKRGQDGLNGTVLAPASPPPVVGGTPAAPGALPQAGQIAAALTGQQAPQSAPATPPGPPTGIPTAPIPQGQPGPGGAPMGQRPFGPSPVANTPAFLAPPTQEDVPDAPAPVARPVAPEAVGPTKSKLLEQAYRIMADANPYESAAAQDMYVSGLSDQDKLNESAAERKQRLIDEAFHTDNSVYANAASQDRGAAIKGREDVIARNAEALKDFRDKTFQYGVHKEDQQFQASENSKNRANTLEAARMRLAGQGGGGGGKGAWGLTPEETAALYKAAGEGRVDVTRLNSRTAKIQAGIFLANPGFDGMSNHGMAALASNPVALRNGQLVTIMPEVLNNVRLAGAKLKFSDMQPMGKVQLWSKGLLNDPDVVQYLTQRNDAMQTLAQVMSGVGATDMRTKMESEAAPKAMSPRAWDGWYKGQVTALIPRIRNAEKAKLVPPGTAEHVWSEFKASTNTAGAGASDGWGKATVVH